MFFFNFHQKHYPNRGEVQVKKTSFYFIPYNFQNIFLILVFYFYLCIYHYLNFLSLYFILKKNDSVLMMDFFSTKSLQAYNYSLHSLYIYIYTYTHTHTHTQCNNSLQL